MTTEQEQYDTLRSEAAEGFDLKARLQNRGLREGQITLYLDEEAGLELGSARDVKNQLQIVVGRVQEGILGELDKLGEDDDRTELEAKRDALIKKLEASALIVKLRAVPPVIAKSARRRAKDSLKIKGKIADDQIEDYNDLYLAYLLSDTIVSITDVASGGVQGKLSYEDAKALKEYLPDQQFGRLDNKLAEIQFKDAVDESVSSDSDF